MGKSENMGRADDLVQIVILSTLVLTNMGLFDRMSYMSEKNDSQAGEHEPGIHVVRVSISEASRLFGIHQRTIRRAISTGELRYIVVRGRYKIQFEALVAWSQRSAAARSKRDTEGIGQWVDQWKIRNVKYSPREPGAGGVRA